MVFFIFLCFCCLEELATSTFCCLWVGFGNLNWPLLPNGVKARRCISIYTLKNRKLIFPFIKLSTLHVKLLKAWSKNGIWTWDVGLVSLSFCSPFLHIVVDRHWKYVSSKTRWTTQLRIFLNHSLLHSSRLWFTYIYISKQTFCKIYSRQDAPSKIKFSKQAIEQNFKYRLNLL